MNAKKEVAKVEDKAVAIQSAGEGMENISNEDILIPRVKVVYGLSKEMKDPELRKTLQQGMIINTNTKEEIKNPIFTVLHFFKTYAKFNPMSPQAPGFNKDLAPGATEFVCFNRNDVRINPAHLEWTDNNPPIVTEMRSFLVLFDGDDLPCVLSFYRSSARTGKELATEIFVPGQPAWNKKFKLYTEEKTDKGVYYVLHVKSVGKATEEEKAKAKQMHAMFSKSAHKSVEAEVMDASSETTAADTRPY